MAKSPVARAGQHDLKGKKYKLLVCRCCVMMNHKDKIRAKEARNEMRNAIKCISE